VDFERNKGKNISVKLKKAINGDYRISGVLKTFDGGFVHIETATEP
jgi:ribosome maturation factor RimP